MISNEHNTPLLNGLILAGGKSRRMGTAKDLIRWHGKEQRYHAADLLSCYCEEVFISCRQEQQESIDPAYKSLPDTFLNMGPLGGMLSALRANRDKAWLIVACDLPLLNHQALQYLVENRAPGKMATSYKSPFDGLPEPLISIWEPSSYPVALHFLGQNVACPRKILMNGDIFLLEPPQPEALLNVNTPEDAAKANEILNKGGNLHP